MVFRIADTFNDSIARLTNDEQTAAKTTAFDLQMNPSQPGLSFHKLDRAKDKRFWSIRVNDDLRMIVHRMDGSLLLCYVGHHQEAYRWAERRRLETHPVTGAAQFVVIKETTKEVVVPVPMPQKTPSPPKPPLFAGIKDDEFLAYGVPPEWLDDVRSADEDTFVDLIGRIPDEAWEALETLSRGIRPTVTPPAAVGTDPFDHPDAQRRFRVIDNIEELRQALEYPWEKWTIFLHPSQKQWVEKDFSGPSRVSGSAGTGKTVVALHRAAFLARQHPEARILLTTFSDPLANALKTKLHRLIGNEPRLAERIEVLSMDAVCRRLYRSLIGEPRVATREDIRSVLSAASNEVADHGFRLGFLMEEWDEVVDAWQLSTWEAYRSVRRLGRRTRLAEKPRRVLWSIFERAQATLAQRGLVTRAGLYTALASKIAEGKAPYDFAVVDESQDTSVPQMRFLAALGSDRPNALFFAGDLGQRIFQQPFSWLSLGVDIRGRARTLHVNYRTSHQIRIQADKLLDSSVSDVDGNTEDRRGTVSVFNGPPPDILILDAASLESRAVGEWIRKRHQEGVVPHEIGVFVRSEKELGRASEAVCAAGLPYKVLDERVETAGGFVSVGVMHLAKGLEFRAVVVMACDDEVIPSQERVEGITDQADLEEVYSTERHLLYVACTRARDHLLVTGVKPASEFLEDLTS